VDGRNIRGHIHAPDEGKEEYNKQWDNGEAPRYAWPRRLEVEVEQMVQDAYRRANEIHEEASAGGGEFPNVRNAAPNENVNVNTVDMEKLIAESTQPVYEGCSVNRLQMSIVLMNMVNLYGVPYSFFDVLLRFLAADLLPLSNCLPRSTYETNLMLMKMGLEHEAIHCCTTGHVVYEGPDHVDLVECPVCGERRYVQGSNTIPQKVLRYFPIIPHLQRLFYMP